MNKALINIGHLSLLITTILAIVFYKERVIYVDPGQQVFEMINANWYKVYVQRYSMVINQTFPLIAIKLGMPLKHVLLAYSLSFVLVYYLCFIICVYGFKNTAAGVCIALTPLLIRQAFGHCISEAWLGVAYSVVFYALLNYYHKFKAKGRWYVFLFYLLALLTIAINYYIHPITLFTIGFALGFTYLHNKEYRSSHIYILSLIVIVIYLVKFLFPSTQHEDSFFSGVRIADELLPRLFTLPIIKFMGFNFLKIYIFIFIPFLISIILYVKKKKTLLIFFVLAYLAFEILIPALAFYKGDAPFALESRLIPLIMITIIPFVELIKDKRKNYFVISGILVFLTISYISLISEVRLTHTKRIKHYEKLIALVEKYPQRKFYMDESIKGNSPINSWGTSVEILLLSSLEGKKNSRTIFIVRKGMNVEEGLSDRVCVFLWVPWWIFTKEDMLNKKYFDLQCSPYLKIQNPENS